MKSIIITLPLLPASYICRTKPILIENKYNFQFHLSEEKQQWVNIVTQSTPDKQTRRMNLLAVTQYFKQHLSIDNIFQLSQRHYASDRWNREHSQIIRNKIKPRRQIQQMHAIAPKHLSILRKMVKRIQCNGILVQISNENRSYFISKSQADTHLHLRIVAASRSLFAPFLPFRFIFT